MNLKKTAAGLTLVVFVLTAGAAAALADATGAAPGTTAGATAGTTAGATAGATAGSLPEVKVTPSSMWYSLKLFFEQMRVTLTMDSAKKAELLMEQARERLAEAQKSVAAGNADAALTAVAAYKKTMGEVAAQAKVAAQAHKALTHLEAQIRSTKPEWARILAEVVAAAPELKRQQLADQLAPVLVEMAQAERIVHKDDHGDNNQGHDDKAKTQQPPATAGSAAKAVAGTDASVVQKMQAAGVTEQTILELKATAQKTGKTLAEVYAMYQIEHVSGQPAGSLATAVKDVPKPAVPDTRVIVKAVKPSDDDEEDDDDGDNHDDRHDEHHGQGERKVTYQVKVYGGYVKGQGNNRHGNHDD